MNATLLTATAPTTGHETIEASDDAPVRSRRRVNWREGVLPTGGVVIAAVAVRAALFPIESSDLVGFLQPWWNEIKAHGHLASLKSGFSNYTPAYLYLLALISYLPISARLAIKALSIAFEGVQAAAFVSVAALTPRGRTRLGRLLALTLALFAPSVILNGAAWAQCDVIHTAFVLLALRAALADRWWRATALAGAALSFKLQATFFLPALVLMLAKAPVPRRKLLALLLVPLVFLISLVPAWWVGRPARELLLIYVQQTGCYTDLTLSAPSIYQWLPGAPSAPLRAAGVVITGAVFAAALYLVRQSSLAWTSRERVLTALATTLACPFLLPSMHERYFYTADVLSMLLPFWLPSRWWVPLAISAASTLCYGNYLFGQSPFELKYLAVLMAVALGAVVRDWGRGLALEWGSAGGGTES